jgi:pyruvate/2-oxoglutarate dehydrogenase complex dihydrolipoamide dehydrogenase (E3) component
VLKREGDAGMRAAAEHVLGAAARLRAADAAATLEQAGVAFLRGKAKFVSPYGLQVSHANGSTTTVASSRFLVATGAEDDVPNIRGLRCGRVRV